MIMPRAIRPATIVTTNGRFVERTEPKSEMNPARIVLAVLVLIYFMYELIYK